MIALSLSAGERATVTMPLGATYQRVRVLVRTPNDSRSTWVDIHVKRH